MTKYLHYSLFLLALMVTACGENETVVTTANQDEISPPVPGNSQEPPVPPVEEEDPFERKTITVRCESIQYKKKVCKLPKEENGFIESVELIEQLSVAECLEHKTFKAKKFSRRMRVLKGCRGDFKVTIISNMRAKKSLSSKEWKNLEVNSFDLSEFDSTVEVGESVVLTEGSGKITYHKEGSGVEGGSPVSYQINHDPVTDETEALAFKLPDHVQEVNVHLSRLFKNEGSGERAGLIALDKDGQVILKEVLDANNLRYKNDHQGRIKIEVQAKYLIFYALPYSDSDSKKGDSSDYLVEKIHYKFLEVN